MVTALPRLPPPPPLLLQLLHPLRLAPLRRLPVPQAPLWELLAGEDLPPPHLWARQCLPAP